jgi:two-component system, LuxR family, response regulator FixJ
MESADSGVVPGPSGAREERMAVTSGPKRGAVAAAARTVFVVDGDEGVRESLELLLTSLRIRVETFPTGEALLGRVEEAVPDCIITEVFLPGMSGLELLRELGARGRTVPVIVMATHADVPLAVEAMQLGALDFVEKPVIDRVIVTRVREALRN